MAEQGKQHRAASSQLGRRAICPFSRPAPFLHRGTHWVCVAVWLVVGGLASPARGDEPAEAFLEALRDNGYYDLALVYLESLESNPAVSAEFKKVLPLERAETLIKSTARVRSLDEWEKRLDQAQALLGDASGWKDSPELAVRARRYQGNLLYRRGRVYLNRADDDRLTQQERQEGIDRAREFLKQSLDAYANAQKELADLIRDYQIDPDDPGSEKKLKRFRATYTKIRIQTPLIHELLSDTYPEGSADRRRLLQQAAEGYAELWDKYHRYAAGLDACLFAARTRHKLGEDTRAISYVQEILLMSDATELRELKRRAMVLAADIWSTTEPYPYDDVIANFEPAIDRLNRAEKRQPDWQRIQLELARAYHRKSAALQQSDPGGNSGEVRQLDRRAALLIKAIAKMPGALRREAAQLIKDWNLTIADTEVSSEKIETFVDAQQKGTDLVAEVETMLSDAAQLKRKLARAVSPDEKLALEGDIEQAEKDLRTVAEQALAMFDLALQLADEKTIREDINNVRYLQSVCYFAMGDYFETAVIGQFLFDRYPNVNGTRQAVGLMIRSFAVLLDNAREADRPAAKQRLHDACTRVLERWPGSVEANDAAATLTRLALADDDLAAAETYLGQISKDSPHFARLHVRLGRGYWVHSKRASTDETSPATDPDALREPARRHLEIGLKNAKPDDLDYELALGALLRVDALLESGDVDSAIQQLESDPVAPLDLIKQKHPAIVDSTAAERYVRETFKIAVKAYLGKLAQAPGESRWIDKAQGIIRQMQADAAQSKDPQARNRIALIYQMIARQLKQQFDGLTDPDEQQAFASNLGRFLNTVAEESSDPQTILWAGATLMSVADTLAKTRSPADAKPMYVQALESFDRIQANDLKNDALKIEWMRQRAIAQRGMGQYDEAFKDLASILEDVPNNLTIQLDAADTLQLWGIRGKRSKALAQAMMGTETFRDPKTKRSRNRVWGWAYLVRALRDKPKLSEAYFHSLYGLIEARLAYGNLEGSDKAKKAALKELQNARRRHPDFGSPYWKRRFEKLETEIKNSL